MPRPKASPLLPPVETNKLDFSTKPKKKETKKDNKKIYKTMDLDKFEDFVAGEDFLTKPVNYDLTDPNAIEEPEPEMMAKVGKKRKLTEISNPTIKFIARQETNEVQDNNDKSKEQE